jgi:hypothetical protein
MVDVKNSYARKLVRFLETQAGDDWFYIAATLRPQYSEGACEVARWMISHPRCERAVAAEFLWNEATGFPQIQADLMAGREPRDQTHRLVREIIDRANQDGFPNCEIGWGGADEHDDDEDEDEDEDEDHIPWQLRESRAHALAMQKFPRATLQIPKSLMPFAGKRVQGWPQSREHHEHFLQTNLMGLGVPLGAFSNRMSSVRVLAYSLGYRRHWLKILFIAWVLFPLSLVAFMAIRDWLQGKF